MRRLGFLNTKIGQRYLAIFLSISLLPLVTVGWFALHSGESALREQTRSVLRAAADVTEAQLREFLGHLKQELMEVAREEDIRGALESVRARLNQTEPGALEALSAASALAFRRTPDVREAFVLDLNGRVVASSAREQVGKDDSGTEFFLRGRDGFYFGDVFRDPETHAPTWVMACPIEGPTDHVLLGVAAFRIDPRTLSDLTTGRRIIEEGADPQSFRGQSGETYIVNRKRLMITESRYFTNAVLGIRVNTWPVRAGLALGEEVTDDYPDYRNVEVSGASMLLRELDWIVITEIDFTQAFAPIQRLRAGLVEVTAALGIIVLFLAWNSTRRIIWPLQLLNMADRGLASGDEAAAEIPEAGLPNDEIGELIRHRNFRVKQLLAQKRELEDRSAKLRESLTELEHLSYSIVHDMRAPLRAITCFGQMLEEDEGQRLQPASREHLVRMIEAARRMDQLIRDVLSYSLLGDGDFPLGPVRVSDLLRGIVETYPAFQPPHAQITVPSDLPTVRGNEAALTQCFSNLLDNAVKFGKPGHLPNIRITGQRQGSGVRISIEDDGIGIPADLQERIFGIFQKIHGRSEGTGIGLAIVRKAAEKMGGRVGVHSVLGAGSCFWIELPAGEEPG